MVERQNEILFKLAPVIDLGKLTASTIYDFRGVLTKLYLIFGNLKAFEYEKFDLKKFSHLLDIAEEELIRANFLTQFEQLQLTDRGDKRLFNLLDDLEKLLNSFKEMAEKKQIKIVLKSQREYRLFADRQHLIRTIQSLLLNSVEALTLSKKKKHNLQIVCERGVYFLWIRIIDNADGIPQNLRKQIFKPFYSSQKEIGGLGMGLYLAQKMMNKFYKSKVRVKTSHKGTMVTLKIKNCFIAAEKPSKKYRRVGFQ